MSSEIILDILPVYNYNLNYNNLNYNYFMETIMKFIGRIKELEALEREYKRKNGFVVIYGRRRVGKTTLIKKFLSDKKALYFLANEESNRQNLNRFTEKIAEFTQQPYIAQSRFENWQSIIRVLAAFRPDEKKILVIDEFQYLSGSFPAFPSVFQEVWDEILSNNNIMVILCGSLISLMTSQVLSHSSPLYGRRTAQIRLNPLRFEEIREAMPERSYTDLTEMYSVTGGVPKYIDFFDNELSLWDNISANILDRSGFLYEEPSFLLEKEVRETVNYFSLMKTIAAGNHKLSAIAGALEMKSTSVTPYLNTLSELFMIEKRLPVTEQNPEKSKKGLYFINDNFIDFWFRFIYPFKSELEMDNDEYVINKIKKAFVENHVSFVFEAVSRELFRKCCLEGMIDFTPSKIGSYWNSDTEIDVVSVDKDNNRIFAGECKYYERPVPADVLFDLQKKTASVSEFRDCSIIYGIFSKSGFEKRLIDIAQTNKNIFLFNNGKIQSSAI